MQSVESMGMDGGEEARGKRPKICLFHTPSAKKESLVEGNPPLLAAHPWFSNKIDMVHSMQEAIGE